MKRFVNYTSNDGKAYEIYASVLPTGGLLTLSLRFENLAKIDVLNFVSDCAEVEYFGDLMIVNLPFEGISYISVAYSDDKEFIREVAPDEQSLFFPYLPVDDTYLNYRNKDSV